MLQKLIEQMPKARGGKAWQAYGNALRSIWEVEFGLANRPWPGKSRPSRRDRAEVLRTVESLGPVIEITAREANRVETISRADSSPAEEGKANPSESQVIDNQSKVK